MYGRVPKTTFPWIVVIAFALSGSSLHATKNDVIYGDDDRKDAFEISDNSILDLVAATVALVPKHKARVRNGVYEFTTKTYEKAFKLCPEEPFLTQPSLAYCSGFWVGEDLIVTAGHCVEEKSRCKETLFVFDFKMHNETTAQMEQPGENVYKCQSITEIKTTNSNSRLDYALIQLDRPVLGRRPLKTNRGPPLQSEDEVFIVGNSAGLPTKFAAGAKVRTVEQEFYTANLDSYAGNSGSAVFNAKTQHVEGILVRGEIDFNYDERRDCLFSKKCSNTTCHGEDFTRIEFLNPLIPQ